MEFTRQRTKYVVGEEYIHEDDRQIFSIYSREKMQELLQADVDKGELRQDTPISIINESILTLISV